MLGLAPWGSPGVKPHSWEALLFGHDWQFYLVCPMPWPSPISQIPPSVLLLHLAVSITEGLCDTFPTGVHSLGAVGEGPILHPVQPGMYNVQLPGQCGHVQCNTQPLRLLSPSLHHLHLHQHCREHATKDILVQISHFFHKSPLTQVKLPSQSLFCRT